MKHLLSFILLFPLCLLANPQNGEVILGNAQFEGMNSSELTVHPSDRAIIQWESFSIDAHETTRFVQGGADAAVLNRVTTDQASLLMGMLQSDGKVYLVNPNGVVIGKEGMIDAGSFIGSTFDITNEAFVGGGDLHFTGDALTSIVNEGRIEASANVLLFAHRVENYGTLCAQGDVQVAAGHRILLAVEGKELLLVQPELDGDGILNEGKIEALRTVLSSLSNPFELGIRNGGTIEGIQLEQNGGEIYLRSRSLIENSGTIKSERVECILTGNDLDMNIQMDGEIVAIGTDSHILLNAEEGIVSVKGSMTASDGGLIHVLGKDVRLEENAFLDASGEFGGGEVLIGGDYQGKNPDILNAQYTFVGRDTTIQANCLLSGDGEKVILWGDEACHYGGKASARGGNQSGDGGLIEVSSPRVSCIKDG